jgi:hypothetical protein
VLTDEFVKQGTSICGFAHWKCCHSDPPLEEDLYCVSPATFFLPSSLAFGNLVTKSRDLPFAFHELKSKYRLTVDSAKILQGYAGTKVIEKHACEAA